MHVILPHCQYHSHLVENIRTEIVIKDQRKGRNGIDVVINLDKKWRGKSRPNTVEEMHEVRYIQLC